MSAEHTVPFANTNGRKNFDEIFFLTFRNKYRREKRIERTNLSLIENVEASLKAFDISLKILRLKDKNFFNNSVKTTIQILYDVLLFHGFEKKMVNLWIFLPSIITKRRIKNK